MDWNQTDRNWMQQCLELARMAYGNTSPNPMVGCVITKDDRLICSGFHRYAGANHAEREAIGKRNEELAGATLYVNLEPCSTFGRTPPCTELIIEHQIKRVVAAMADPNPLHAGKGFELLRHVGIQVDVGVLENEARKLNEVFCKNIVTGLPYIIVKSALSLDGKIATACGESQWITSPESRTDSHLIRKGVDGVMVGIGTVIADDPDLTVRHVTAPRQQPARIIIDPNLRIPFSTQLVAGHSAEKTDVAATIIITSEKSSATKMKQLQDHGIEVIMVPSDTAHRLSMRTIVSELGNRGITSIMLEGGPTTIGYAFEEKIVDKVIYYLAPKIIGGYKAPGPVGGLGIEKLSEAYKLQNINCSKIGADIRIEAYCF